MNDDSELSEVRESLLAEGAGLAGVHMDRPAEAVMARGRALRLRRRLLRGLSCVTAAGAAMALALALPLSGTGVRQVHVTETDWSVNTSQNGTVIVSLRRVSDPLRLQSVLAEAGIPAAVHWGESCAAPGLGWPSTRIVAPRFAPLPAPSSNRARRTYVFSIHPARIPAHFRFVIGARPYLRSRPLPPYRPFVTWALVPASARLTCTKNGTTFWAAHGICAASGYASPSPSPYSSPSPRRYSSPSPSPYSSPSPSRYSSPSPSPYSSPSRSPYSSPSPSPGAACASTR
jgi:hypothetical protein